MKHLPYLIVFLFLLYSCGVTTHTDYGKEAGLSFTQKDWKEKELERPFLITSEVSTKLKEGENKLFLPAKMFDNTQIDLVYFDGMKSDKISKVEGEKPRYEIYFDKNTHKCDVPHEMEKDEAVVYITVEDEQKVIKIKDIRVPFYN